MRSTALVTAVLVGLLVTACSTGTTGTAVPGNPPGGAAAPGSSGSGGSAPPSSAANTFGAPQVTNPLNVSKYLADPCTTLSGAQQSSLHISSVKKSVVKDPVGNICEWDLASDVHYSVGFTVQFDPGQGQGLASAYKTAHAANMKRLPDSGGVPVVTEPLQNTDGNCTVYVGATDKVLLAADIEISKFNPASKNSCTIAGQIADDAASTMRSGG